MGISLEDANFLHKRARRVFGGIAPPVSAVAQNNQCAEEAYFGVGYSGLLQSYSGVAYFVFIIHRDDPCQD